MFKLYRDVTEGRRERDEIDESKLVHIADVDAATLDEMWDLTNTKPMDEVPWHEAAAVTMQPIPPHGSYEICGHLRSSMVSDVFEDAEGNRYAVAASGFCTVDEFNANVRRRMEEVARELSRKRS